MGFVGHNDAGTAFCGLCGYLFHCGFCFADADAVADGGISAAQTLFPAEETGTGGTFAAGDIVSGSVKQVVVAASQGAIAALSAIKYINKNK